MMRILLFLPVTLLALYLGNPSASELPESGIWIDEARSFGLKLGEESSIAYLNGLELENPSKRVEVESCRLRLSQGLIGVSWNNRVEIYSGLGGLATDFTYLNKPDVRLTLKTPQSFSWEIGGRTLLLFWKQAALGFDVKLLSTHSPHTSYCLNGVKVPSPSPWLHLKQWHIGGGLSYQISWLTPYIGLMYNTTKIRVGRIEEGPLTFSKKTFIQNDKFILALGTSVTAEKAFDLTIESAIIGENRLSIVFNLRF